MSTSCDPGRSPQPIAPFPYNELPPVGVLPTNKNAPVSGRADCSFNPNNSPENTANAAARDAARREGEASARTHFDEQVREIRESVRNALNEFTHERATYYEQVEGEVVQLALNIVRKILHRESQIDPWLMAGMVRVALERLENATELSVRVAPPQVSECREYFAQNLDSGKVPEVIEDASLALNHCVLKTALGTTEIGPEIQLREIEQGLLDLLDRRPKAKI